MQKTIADGHHKQQQLRKERVFAMLGQVWARTRDVPEQELGADAAQAVATLRQEQRKDPHRS